jgi:hypothetical protein
LTRFRVKASPLTRRLAELQSPNRVHVLCFLRLIWFFPLPFGGLRALSLSKRLSTPPRGDAVTSSSQSVNGPNWPESFTPEDDAAPQRTSPGFNRLNDRIFQRLEIAQSHSVCVQLNG